MIKQYYGEIDLFIILCLFFDILYIVFRFKKKNILGTIFKTIAALCFIIIGYYGYLINKSTYSVFILFGLILDGFGDFFLALRNIIAKNIMFIIGTICFLVGHIMFIRALLFLSNYYLVSCAIIALIISLILFSIFNKVCHFNKIYGLVGILYLSVIMTMVCISIGVYFSNSTISNLIFMIGSIMFVSSDIILILYNFSNINKWFRPIYSILYFVGQIMISLSLHIL